MTILFIVLQISLVFAIVFWAMSFAHKRAQESLRVSLLSWVAHRKIDCEELAKKRKGNNFGDQIYRAAMKGNADAYLSVIDALNQIKQ